jgi:hypothetical protein
MYLRTRLGAGKERGRSEMEEKTSEAQRILEMIKTGEDPDKAAENLSFLRKLTWFHLEEKSI